MTIIITPPPPDVVKDSRVWRDWIQSLYAAVSKLGVGLFSQLDFTGSNLISIATRNHNDLQNIQGGAAGDYNHLTTSQISAVNNLFPSDVIASEALAAGDFINLWNNAGTINVRKADARVIGKEAHGFILTLAQASSIAHVFYSGINNKVTGLTPGVIYLSSTIAGGTTSTSPNAPIVQNLGVAISATKIECAIHQPSSLDIGKVIAIAKYKY